MSSETCAYKATKDDPKSWHGTSSDQFYLDRDPSNGGLGISEWHCPHPVLEQDDGGKQYCVFHTDPAELPESIDQEQALLDALKDAGKGGWPNRPEHRGQFIGATFSGLNLYMMTIAATEDHDVRFDHAQFHPVDEFYGFMGTTFVTQSQHPISFAGQNSSAAITTGGSELRHSRPTATVT